MWFENGPIEPTRPCCFAAAELLFLGCPLCYGGINRLFYGVWASKCHNQNRHFMGVKLPKT